MDLDTVGVDRVDTEVVVAADGEQVGAAALDTRGDVGRGAAAEAHGREHRGYADDDAEHGQDGAHLVRKDAADRDAEVA